MNLRDETLMKIAAGEATGRPVMPSPPYPDPDDPALQFVITNTLRLVQEGEQTIQQAVIYAAVHGWYEGYLNAVDGPVDPAALAHPE